MSIPYKAVNKRKSHRNRKRCLNNKLLCLEIATCMESKTMTDILSDCINHLKSIKM